MATLVERLAALSPKESDELLAAIWRSFKDTDAHQALSITLQRLREGVLSALLTMSAKDSERAWAAGVVWAVESLQLTVKALTEQDLSKLTPEPPPTNDENIVVPQDDLLS